jgi:hypothetical protein
MAERILTEEEITKGMVDDTELEIADFAFDDEEPSDDDGDTSLEQMDDDVPGEVEEGDDEPDETDDEPDAGEEDEGGEDDEARDEEQDDEAPDDTPQERSRLPSDRLRTERDRRRQIETELANARARIAAYEVSQQQQRSPPPPREEPQKPDIFLDPEGWAANQRAEIFQEIRAQHVNATLSAAHEEHGRDFEAAYRALTSLNPQDAMARAVVQRIWNAPNPGSALMRWHSQQRTINEIGDDPEAWFERKFQERMSDPDARRQALSNLRNEAMRGDGGRPRTATRLPRSLNSASGGGGRGRREADPSLYDDSDTSVFEYAMR